MEIWIVYKRAISIKKYLKLLFLKYFDVGFSFVGFPVQYPIWITEEWRHPLYVTWSRFGHDLYSLINTQGLYNSLGLVSPLVICK